MILFTVRQIKKGFLKLTIYLWFWQYTFFFLKHQMLHCSNSNKCYRKITVINWLYFESGYIQTMSRAKVVLVTAGLFCSKILLTGTNLCLLVFVSFFAFASSFLLRPHFHTGHKHWSIGKCIILVRALFVSLSVENPISLSQVSDTVSPQTGCHSVSSQAFCSNLRHQLVNDNNNRWDITLYIAYRSAYRHWKALAWRSNALNIRVGRWRWGA